MAEAGDVGGGSRQPPLLLEHLRMHFLKEENNSPFSSGQNLSSSAGSAGASPTSLSASGTTPLDEPSARAGSSPGLLHRPSPDLHLPGSVSKVTPPRSPCYAPLMVHNSPLPTWLLQDTRLPTGPRRPLSHPTSPPAPELGPYRATCHAPSNPGSKGRPGPCQAGSAH